MAGPPLQGDEVLPAGGAPDPSSSVPLCPIFRKTLLDLLEGEPFPESVVALPEVRRGRDRDGLPLAGGDDPGRLDGPSQVARIDPLQIDGGQARRQGLGLPLPPFVKGDVRLPLDPLVAIPGRFAMPDEINNGNGSPPSFHEDGDARPDLRGHGRRR